MEKERQAYNLQTVYKLSRGTGKTFQNSFVLKSLETKTQLPNLTSREILHVYFVHMLGEFSNLN